MVAVRTDREEIACRAATFSAKMPTNPKRQLITRPS